MSPMSSAPVSRPTAGVPTSATELSRLTRRADEVVCYVVEVCPDCAWNHLARMYPAGGRHRAAASAARRGNG